jgi:hypothetical protein
MWALLPSFAKLRGDRDGGLKFNVDLGPSEEATGLVRPISHTTEASTHPLALKKYTFSRQSSFLLLLKKNV